MSAEDRFAAAGRKETVDLSEVTALAHKQLKLEGELDALEVKLKEKKAELSKVAESDLPAAMKAAGMKTFGLENGMTVSYAEDMKVSVPKAKKGAVIATMKQWGYEADVSNLLTVDLGKGNDNAVKALKASAEEMGVEAVVTEDIATGTVKKALNARRKDGKQDQLGDFGAFLFTKATVK